MRMGSIMIDIVGEFSFGAVNLFASIFHLIFIDNLFRNSKARLNNGIGWKSFDVNVRR